MNTKAALLAFFVALGFTSVSGAAQTDLTALWTCSTDTETRSLSIGDKDGGGCDLHYEKNDSVKIIAWSSHSTEPCLRTRDKIVGDLKKAGWKCSKSK